MIVKDSVQLVFELIGRRGAEKSGASVRVCLSTTEKLQINLIAYVYLPLI